MTILILIIPHETGRGACHEYVGMRNNISSNFQQPKLFPFGHSCVRESRADLQKLECRTESLGRGRAVRHSMAHWFSATVRAKVEETGLAPFSQTHMFPFLIRVCKVPTHFGYRLPASVDARVLVFLLDLSCLLPSIVANSNSTVLSGAQ